MRRLFLLLAVILALLIPVESFAGPFMVLHKRGSAWSGGGSAVIDVDGDAANAGWKYTGYFAAGWGRIRLGKPGGNLAHAFIRFPECPVPQGKTLTKADLKLYVHSASGNTGTAWFKFYCNDVDDAAVPADEAAMNALTRTTAYLDTNFATDPAQYSLKTFDIKEPLQEVINRGGYAAGNDVQVLIETYDCSVVDTQVDLYVTDATYYAVLELEWE